MPDHTLVPFDGSPAARSAVNYASEQFPDALITLLYVVNPMAEYSRRRAYPGYTADDEFTTERQKAEYLLDSVLETLPGDVTARGEIEVGSPTETIIDYVDTNDVDQIVIGSHGRDGVARFLLGSVTETVVRRSSAPVTVVRPDSEQTSE